LHRELIVPAKEKKEGSQEDCWILKSKLYPEHWAQIEAHEGHPWKMNAVSIGG